MLVNLVHVFKNYLKRGFRALRLSIGNREWSFSILHFDKKMTAVEFYSAYADWLYEVHCLRAENYSNMFLTRSERKAPFMQLITNNVSLFHFDYGNI